MASIPNKKMRGRAILVAALLIIVGFGLVIHQLYRVQLVEGESYKQEAMSRQLGVSRATLREALRALLVQGVVEVRRGRGGSRPTSLGRAISMRLKQTPSF